MKIIFLDIDGVFIPTRMYLSENQTKPVMTVFCPSVVGMVNEIAKNTGAKFVIHSSWLRTSFHGKKSVHEHMIDQGLKPEYFHEDHSCLYTFSGTRWNAILDWMCDNGTPNRFVVIDDEPVPYGLEKTFNSSNVVTTEFDEGLTFKQFLQISEMLSDKEG